MDNPEQRTASDAPTIQPGRALDGKSQIHGVARDGTTHEPVPYVGLTFEQGKTREEVETDARGRYSTETRFAEGPLVAFVKDPPDSAFGRTSLGEMHHLGPGREDGRLDLDLRASSTLFIEFEPPPPLSSADFMAELIGLHSSYFLDHNDWSRHSLRGESPYWVRVRKVGNALPAYSGHRLELKSRDGHWRGSTRIGANIGDRSMPLHVDLTPSGILEGMVKDERARPLEDVWVIVTPIDGPIVGPFPREFRTDRDGRFQFRWLSPGTYSVTTANDWYAPLHELARESVEVDASRTTARDLVMARVDSAGSISGQLTSQTGSYWFESTQLELRSLTNPNRRLITLVESREVGGRYIANFLFDEVPMDEYELFVVGGGEQLWKPPRLVVTPPLERGQFSLQDRGDPLELSFEVTDADSGALIEELRLMWHFADGTMKRARGESNRYTLRGILPGAIMSWTVVAPGYQPVSGDASDFTLAVDPPEGYVGGSKLRRARVRLRPGWGATVIAHGPDGVPIAGVRVLVDESVVGETGENGRLYLSSDVPPVRIAVEHEAWAVSGGDLIPYGGRVAGSWGEVDVPMAPRD